jgi:nucleotide-binding universal stress UspA family protein
VTRRTSPRLDRIAVAVDFSEGSMVAARWVAQHFAPGAELVLVHVIHVPSVPRFVAGQYPSADRLVETARAGAEVRLRGLSEAVATGFIWPEVRVGKPAEEIVRVAVEYGAGLVVVGPPAARAGVWGRIGATAQRVLRRSPVPLMLAAGAAAWAPARLLVAVDDSDMTDVVLDWGGHLAERLPAEAAVLHVVSVPLFSGSSVPAGLPPWVGVYTPRHGSPEDGLAVREAKRWLVERLRGVDRGHRMSPAVVSGQLRPAQAIVGEAVRRRAELIVVGSSGAGAVPRLLFGSVVEGVLRDAPCPVLVVGPPAGAARGCERMESAARLPTRTGTAQS